MAHPLRMQTTVLRFRRSHDRPLLGSYIAELSTKHAVCVMDDWIVNLLALQAQDQKLRKLKLLLESVPTGKETARTQIATAESELEDAHQKVLHAQAAIKDVENRIESIRAKMRDFQTKSAMIKNNEEYRAALAQAEACEADIEQLETRELELMDELEEARALHAKKKKAHNAMKLRIEEITEDLNTRQKNCEKRARTMLASRKDAIAKVPKDAFRLYERIRKSRRTQGGKPAFVPLVDGTCGSCFMKATAQCRVDVIKGIKRTCEHCGALLYPET